MILVGGDKLLGALRIFVGGVKVVVFNRLGVGSLARIDEIRGVEKGRVAERAKEFVVAAW